MLKTFEISETRHRFKNYIDQAAAQEYKVAVAKIEAVTSDIKFITLRLITPSAIKFKPGQFVNFQVPGTDEFRAYPIASAPSQENVIELVVPLVPGDLCSTHIHKILSVGDEITVTGPSGEFFLREESPWNIICIGSGYGMAPIRSILYYLAEKRMPRKIIFFFGARNMNDLFFTEDLFSLSRKFHNFQYIPALSEPEPGDDWYGEVGLVTQVAEKSLSNSQWAEAYLCGSLPMIDGTKTVLMKKGVPAERIYYGEF